MVFGLVLLSTGSLAGCAEIQQAAENAARCSGNHGWRKRSMAVGISSVGCFLLGMKRNKPSDKRLPYR